MQRTGPGTAFRRPAPGVLALLLVLLPPGVPPVGAEEPPSAAALYVRAPRSIADTVRYLEGEATRIGATQVLVAFDVATFDPPPGLTEYTLEYPFFDDLPAWLAALGDWAGRAACMLRGTTSLAPKTIDLKEPGALGALEDLVHGRWWEGDRPTALPPAARWITDALARTQDAVRAADQTPVRMLVLIACSVTPERWVRADADKGYESQWRGKLAPVGDYFEEGQVGAALARAGCRLYVVAPEARFGDFAPIVEVPELPWVARPHLPPDDLRLNIGQMGTGATRGRTGREGLRQMLDRTLAPTIPDPEERRKRIEQMLRDMPDVPAPTTPRGPQAPGITTTHQGGLRFVATTPVWFKMIGGTVPFNNHAPSGYGIWPYARAAAQSGGRYVFYPFPESEWLDLCPSSPLVNDLAPELVSRAAYLTGLRGDPAVGALARACALVFDETPWADTWFQHRAARSWTSITRANPLRIERHAWQRRKPYDDALWGSERGIERIGEHIRDEVLPRYDRAIALLDEAAARLEPRAGDVHPRSHANLLLARYWFCMSAFHLQAYSLYALEIDRFIPPDMVGHVDRVLVTYVPTIRLSDCLDAYDGRELDLAGEARYRRWVPPNAPGYQGNILDIPVEEADFRARRRIASVLRHLDKRLHGRALRMIESARDVMRTYGRTGWGWTTYYSDAFTFIFMPVEVPRGHQPSRGGGKSPPRPTTPRGGGGGHGGSKGGGPATGGK